MKLAELKTKSEKELRELVANLQAKKQEFRFLLAAGKAKNTREIRAAKKTIAQAKTLLREKKQ